MKRSLITRYSAIILLTTYFGMFFYYILSHNEILPYWFSIGLIFISVWCLIKAYYFHLDSNFFLGILLLSLGIVGILRFYLSFIEDNLLIIYLLCPCIACLLTEIFYKKKLLYGISFILLLEDFLILLYSYDILNLLYYLVINFIILTLIGGRYVFKRNKRLQQKRSKQKN